MGTLNIIITKLKAAPMAKRGTCFALRVFFTILAAAVHIGSIAA
jgi:hypothetical protein